MNESNIYVPGMWQCPQCKFVQQNNILAPNGVFANTAPELRPCPNDGRDMNPVTWKHYAEQADAWGGKLLSEKEQLLSMLWRVYEIGDCDWWLARTVDEALQSYLEFYSYTAEMITEVLYSSRELSRSELEAEIFIEDDYDPTDPTQWQCSACGEMCSLKDRWTGSAYEHSHGGQFGHFPAVNLKRRTYAQELARRIADGPKVEQFASTEI